MNDDLKAVMLTDPLRPMHPTWEVGKTYLTRGMAHSWARVRVVATDMKCDRPIVGILCDGDHDEEVWTWGTDGIFSRSNGHGSLDLTTEEAAP